MCPYSNLLAYDLCETSSFTTQCILVMTTLYYSNHNAADYRIEERLNNRSPTYPPTIVEQNLTLVAV